MKWGGVLRFLSLFLLLFALSMIFPLFMAFFLSEAEMIRAFGGTALFTVTAALSVFFLTRKSDLRFSAKDGFMLVFLTWVTASLVGALPFYISGHIPGFADAVFESVSGFTTTGSSIIADVEIMPRSLIFWRAETHWLGGMGIIVLTVALLPFLGAEGFLLIKAETTGPDKDRFTPKITETARILWFIYFFLTALQTVLLVIAGMGWFDAVVHAFSTVATGGFSSKNAGLAYWNSRAIVWIVSVFMLIAGFNFTLIFRLVKGKWKDAWFSSESRGYIIIVLAATAVIAAAFFRSGKTADGLPPAGINGALSYHGLGGSICAAFFYTLSVITTTGITGGGFSLFTPLSGGVLFLLMFIGGCSGSTAGGIKVIRIVVLLKQGVNEMKKILNPRGVFSVHLNGKAGRKDVVLGVAGFIYLYFLLLAVSTLIVAGSGLDPFSSFSVSLISLGNIGLDPGLQDPVTLFREFPGYVKWTLSFIMIAGRLELWTALVIFSKEYWK